MSEMAQHLLASSPAIIYACKSGGRYDPTFVSNNVLTILGYPAEEFVDNPGFWLQHIHDEDRERVLANLKTLPTTRHQINEYRFSTGDRGYRWMRDEVRLVRNETTGEEELIGSWFDINDQKEAEARLKEMDCLKSEFIATASHELRNPVTIIQGYSELMLENDRLSPEQREFLSIIHSKALALEQIINDLLDVSRAESGRMLCLDFGIVNIVEELQQEIAQLAQKKASHHLAVTLPKEAVYLTADRGKVLQVVQNLLGNALKFSPKGSDIVIEAKKVDAMFQVMVADRGIGISPENQKHVFNKFYRVDSKNTAAPGLGLGLYLARAIIEAHQGQIWVESVPGQGARFYFTLPLPKQTSAAA
ncbi:MAG: PAS domain-containing sensor histidine kinase [Desulfuromonadales bacterium]|nr:PAS domain-containing sensor histidine kinase [Desulfuromonadales bacterium]